MRETRARPERRQVAALDAALASLVDVIEAGEPAEAMRRPLVHAVEAVGAERGSLSRIEAGKLVIEATYDPVHGHAQPGSESSLDEHPRILRALAAEVPVFVDDVEEPVSGRGLKHSILQPLYVRGRAVGLLAVSRRRADPFDADDLDVFRVFGRGAAVLFFNARLIAEKDAANAELRSLLEVSVRDATRVAQTPDAQQIIAAYVERAQRMVDADRCTLTSIDQQVVRVEASHERDGAPSWVGSEYPLDVVEQQPLLRDAIATGRITTGSGFDTAQADPRLVSHLEAVQQVAVLPLKIADEVVAVLILSRVSDRPYAELDLLKLQHIGSIAVLGLRYARALGAVQVAQRRGLDALLFVSEHMASSQELRAFFGKMSATAARLVNARKAVFWRIHEEELVAEPDGFGFDTQTMAAMRVPLATSPAILEIARGEPVHGLFDLDSVAAPVKPVLEAMQVRDFIAVPWRTAEQPLGLVTVFDSVAGGFTAEDVWVLRIVARASALVWQADQAERRALQLEEREKAQLRATAARAEQLEKVKSEFLRLASHELRGPLSLAKGYTSLLEDGVFGKLGAEASATVELVAARLNQMGLLIDQLLDAARLEDSRLALAMRPIDLADVVRAAWAALEPLKGPNHVMVLELRTTRAEVVGDPDKLQTVIANLISNAIKYSPAGGEIRCRLSVEDGHALVDVVDHGIGITPDQRKQLFKKFGRVDRPETAAIGGTGLGLYLSQELTRRHGGEITVRSRPGKETVFTLRLPLRKPDAVG